MKMRKSPLIPALAIMMALSVVAGVVTFTQTIPDILTVTQPLVAGCPVLQADADPVYVGTAGAKVFSCPTGAAALSSAGAASVEATFDLAPTAYTALRLVEHPVVGSVSACAELQGIVLASNATVSVPAGSWDYCADYESAPDTVMPGFSVTWTL